MHKKKMTRFLAGILSAAMLMTSTGMEQLVYAAEVSTQVEQTAPIEEEESAETELDESDLNEDAEASEDLDREEIQDEQDEPEMEETPVESDAENEVVTLDEDGNIASGVVEINGGHVEWVIDGDGKLTVTGEGDFGYGDKPWSQYAKQIKTAEVNLTACKNAKGMFSGCSSLIQLDMRHFDTSDIDDMSYMFSNCASLTQLNLSRFNTSKTEFMNYMFSGCENLVQLDMRHFDTSKVKGMEGMFNRCINLLNLNLSSFDTSQVASMGYMFNGCLSLREVDLSKFSINKCMVHYMFSGCTSLFSLDLSNFDYSDMTVPYGFLKKCGVKNLKTPTNIAEGLKHLLFVSWELPEDGTWYLSDGTSPDASYHSDSVTLAKDRIPDREGEKSGSVYYFSRWDASTQTAYFGTSDLLGCQVTEETDMSFLGNVDSLVGKYVLVSKENRTDGTVGSSILLSLTPVTTMFGTISDANDETITFNEKEYQVPEDWAWMSAYKGKKVLVHIDGDQLAGILALDKEDGTVQDFDEQTREITVKNEAGIQQKYVLSDLADEESVRLLTDEASGELSFYMDAEKNVYQCRNKQEEVPVEPAKPRAVVTTSSDNGGFIYQNGKYRKSEIKLNFNIEFGWTTFNFDGMTEEERESASIDIDKISFELSDEKLSFEKNSVVSAFEKNIGKTIKEGESIPVEISLYIDSSYVPDVVKEVHNMKVMLNGQEENISVNIMNLDNQSSAAEEDVSLDDVISELDAVLNNTELALGAELNYYFTYEQQKDIQEMLDIWLADIVAATAASPTIEERARDKIYEKLNMKVETPLGIERVYATTEVTGETINYGKRTFIFSVDMMKVTFDSDSSYTATGNLTYQIKDTSGLPAGLPTSGRGIFTFADVASFLKSVQGYAEKKVKDAYGKVWGSSANRVAELFTDLTISKILEAGDWVWGTLENSKKGVFVPKQKFGSFSNGAYYLFTQPAKIAAKKLKVSCPVDVYVYDLSGNLKGSIINNEIVQADASMAMYVEGDVKNLYLSGNDYTIELVGNDDGEMSYQIEEYGEDMELLRTVQFNNLVLTEGKTYTGIVPEAMYIDHDMYSLETDDTRIKPDVDTYQDEKTEKVPVTDIHMQQSSIELAVGEEVTLQTEIVPENATYKQITLESSDENVVAAGTDGKVTAVGEGIATITARTLDRSYEARCSVTVAGYLDSAMVVFDSCGGSRVEPMVGIRKGDIIGELPVPYYYGYQFMGWFTEADGRGEKLDYASQIVENTKVYAFWMQEDNIAEGLWMLDIPDQTYTSSPIRPTLAVYDHATLLKEGTDYTLSYKNNTKVGTAQVILKGKGDYTKTITAEFQIVPKTITSESIRITVNDQKMGKSGKKIVSALTVTDGKKKLKEGTDYQISFGNYFFDEVTAGQDLPVQISGIGNYTGETEQSFHVYTSTVSGFVADPIGVQNYTGQEICPKITVYASKADQAAGKPLTEDQDYTISYQNNIQTGTGKVQIHGLGNYGGTKTVSFKISAKNMAETDIMLENDSYTYTGSQIRPAVTVKQDGRILNAGTDYTVTYKNNVNVSEKAEVIVKGKGNYTGTITAYFAIIPKQLNEENGIQVTVKDVKVKDDTTVAKPIVIVMDGIRKLREGKDYQVNYETWRLSDELTGRTPVVYVTGVDGSNYLHEEDEDWIAKTFHIYKQTTSVADCEILLDQDTFVYTGSKLTPAVTVLYQGETLQSGKDYQVTYKNNINVPRAGVKDTQKPQIVVSGKGRFKDKTTLNFEIRPLDFKTLESIDLTVSERVYTGKELKPAVDISFESTKLKAGKDFVITGYQNNICCGEKTDTLAPTVTIEGKGNYMGTLAGTFRIYEKSISKVYVEKVKAQTYTGDPLEPELMIRESGKTSDRLSDNCYEVRYENNVKAGIGHAIITGTGAYGGTKKVTFIILPRWLSWLAIN